MRNADAIVLVDGAGTVRFANPAAEALFRRAHEPLEGSAFGFPVVAGESHEVDVFGPDGVPCVAEMRVVNTEWEGEPAFLAVLRDITERKRAEEARAELIREQEARAQAEAAVRDRDEFLAIASHELRTPASTLSAGAQLLRRRMEKQIAEKPGSVEPRTIEMLSRLDEQGRRLGKLITQLLDVSRINAGQLQLVRETVDLARLVRRVVDTFGTTRPGCKFVLDLPESMDAELDPVRIEQVISNLVDNACKYGPTSGPVEVRLERIDGAARIAVRDHGDGISPDRRASIFDRYYQAQAKDAVQGLGLGLFISRQIVERHGGCIYVDFPGDGGSRFIVELPLH